MDHPGLDELDRPLAKTDLLPGRHYFIRPIFPVIVFQQGLLASWGTDQLLRLDYVHHLCDRPGVVRFHVIYDQIVNLGWLDHLVDAVEQIVLERLLDRVKKGYLVVNDQISVVGGPFFS